MKKITIEGTVIKMSPSLKNSYISHILLDTLGHVFRSSEMS